MSAFFIELLESVQQMDEIVKGEREPSREFHVACMNGSFRVYLNRTSILMPQTASRTTYNRL